MGNGLSHLGEETVGLIHVHFHAQAPQGLWASVDPGESGVPQPWRRPIPCPRRCARSAAGTAGAPGAPVSRRHRMTSERAQTS